MQSGSIFYHPDTIATQYRFDTTRKGDEIARQLTQRGWHVTTPPLVDATLIECYHDLEYVEAISTGSPVDLAESQGFIWDTGMWDSVVAQVSSMVAACTVAHQGGRAFALSAGFHHARADHGAGFCTFNGVAIGCGELLAQGHHVIILDVDAHHGGGTYSLVHDWPQVMHVDLSTNYYDSYRCAQQHRQVYVDDAGEYLPQLTQLLEFMTQHVTAQTVLVYNAGIDIHEHSAIGGINGITTAHIIERERLVAEWATRHGIGVAACLAGGYHGERWSEQALYDTHIASISALLTVTA